MKKLKILNIILSLIVAGLSIWIIKLKKDLQETNEVLEQCSNRYYKEIDK